MMSAFLAVVGCTALSNGAAHREAIDVKSSKSEPIQNLTNFTEALSCMDSLFEQYGKRGFTVTSNGILDASGELNAGTRDMVISAVARMSRRSRAFTYLDYEVLDGFGAATDLDNVVARQNQAVQQQILSRQRIPQFYIRGSISQFDDGILTRRINPSLGVRGIGQVDLSLGDNFSAFSVDMNIGKVLTREILPDTTSSNTIAIRNIDRGLGVEAEGTIQSNNFSSIFDVSYGSGEGAHTAIRNLVELSLIESLGRLTQVPYWRCLNIGQTNPRVGQQVETWYSGMSSVNRVRFVQRTLGANGFYVGPDDGVMTSALSDAIGRFQRSRGDLANGRITLELYTALVSGDIATASPGDSAPDIGSIAYNPVPDGDPVAPDITAQIAFRRDGKVQLSEGEPLQRGDVVYAAIRPSRNGYLYCYYQDAEDTIYRIFPNRYEPNALVEPSSSAIIAPSDKQDEIRILMTESGANEEIRCYASSQEIGLLLPTELKARDLEPLPVASFDQLETEFLQRTSAPISQARLPIVVE